MGRLRNAGMSALQTLCKVCRSNKVLAAGRTLEGLASGTVVNGPLKRCRYVRAVKPENSRENALPSKLKPRYRWLSLLPALRTNKDEGQQNFVNPGILVVFAGANAELTPKLRGFANVSWLRFQTTAPLEALLFQAPIDKSVGLDVSIGAQYRPPLTENIVVALGAGVMRFGRGMREIDERGYVTSLFANLRLLAEKLYRRSFTPKELGKYGERWAPFRSAAAWHLWRFVDTQTPDASKI